MKCLWTVCLVLMIWGIGSTAAVPVQAQGLIWTLPQEGDWVRYEGTYTQKIQGQGGATQGELTLSWQKIVTLKSLNTENADFRDVSQPCRWVEIKVETGNQADGKLTTGPGGTQLYRLLIPVSAIQGTVTEKLVDDRDVLVSYVPIVKGYRKSGEDEAVELDAGVFQLYPVVALIHHYRNLKAADSAEKITVPAGDFEATAYQGNLTAETAMLRSTNNCTLFRSAGIPFGVVKWTASTVEESKGSTDPRSEFKESTSLSEELQAVETGTGAEAELIIQ
jgi:hypothetical protein